MDPKKVEMKECLKVEPKVAQWAALRALRMDVQLVDWRVGQRVAH